MTFQEINPGIMDEFERKLGSLESVNATPAVRASLVPIEKEWNKTLPPPYVTPGYRRKKGSPAKPVTPVKGSIVVRAKKVRGKPAWFGAVGGDRDKSPNARLLHLLEKGHKTRAGTGKRKRRGEWGRSKGIMFKTRASWHRKRAIERTQGQRDRILSDKLDKIVDKVLGG